ncbi:alpha/beta fold hydrolase [Hoeflea ulvae]|uniref:Proline iminopeptidase n=1 Tax=Hoeflea ulvae TaxID=2983764 RepID=A0ABT3YDC9_9HYPH|nr:alpha/beta fold hydrolase [Hoeflea ulvae]MCY0093822.1 alpha/beta fold hydrolase [Hoeflea ulvae]
MTSDGFHLDVGDGHAIWVAPWGNPDGVPVVFLHGGPGSGCAPSARGLFDAARCRVIFIDQRGAGRSLPARARHANTTQHLIEDIERVRQYLKIERWLVVGGSWGATLGLAYAQAHPSRVTGLGLRAVFLGTRAELVWALDTALAAFHPALHQALYAPLTEDERRAPLTAIWQRILDPDPAVHTATVRAFYRAERALSELHPAQPGPDTDHLPASPFLEAHYFLNDCFLPPDSLLQSAASLAGIPGILVQARLDLLCPPVMSHRLAALWPDSEIRMVEAAGHSVGHEQVFAALRQAVSDLTA